jgi:hypothetical protein
VLKVLEVPKVLRVLVLRVLRVLVLKVPAVLMVLGVSMAQTPPPVARNGIITGQVVDAATGRPVGAAIVTISGTGITMRVTPVSAPGAIGTTTNPSVPRILTGGDGRFTFRDLPAGSFSVTAIKNGYADGASGRRRPGGAPQQIVLTDAQRPAEVSVRIWKNAAIGGTVIDEAGEPVVGVQVRALARSLVAGRRRFTPSGGGASTDDRGMYRFSNLTPGEYLVMASPPTISARLSTLADVGRGGRGVGELAFAVAGAGMQGGLQVGDALLTLGRGSAIPPPPAGDRMQIYPTTFHPSALLPAQASRVTLASGEERLGVDVQLQPAATSRVSGILSSPAGPAAMTAVRLFLQGGDEIPSSEFLGAFSFTDSAGAFTFPAVPPGQYVLNASGSVGPVGSSPGSNLFWVNTPITIGGDDIDGLSLVLRPALRVSARFEFEGATPRPTGPPERPSQFMPLPFILESDDNRPSPAVGGTSMSPDQFTIGGFSGGKYRVRVQNSPQGWMFKSAMLNGVDVSETLFELTRDVTDLVITFTDRWSGMGGSVQGAGADGATVAVFPVDAQAWTNYGSNPRRLRNTSTNAKGAFGLSSVPPGDYYVVAFPEELSADWRDPKMLEALSRVAARVTILEGEHKMIDLRIREIKP